MPSPHTFEEYVEQECYDAIYRKVNSYVIENRADFDVESRTLEEVNYAEVEDLSIHRILIFDEPGNAIKFDVVAKTNLEVKGYRGKHYESDNVQQWFRVSCSGVLDSGLKALRILDVEIYDHRQNPVDNKLPTSLVPIIKKDEFDAVAEAFLTNYFPEALEIPTPLPVKNIASRMGLEIDELSLSRNLTVFGMIVFSKCTSIYFDDNDSTYEPKTLNRGTIIVDPDVYFKRNLGCWNNTVIHECVHWFLHQKHFELVQLFDKSAVLISCRVNEPQNSSVVDWDDEQLMEWQANGITPRILMPRKMVIQKANEIMDEFRGCFPDASQIDAFDYLIPELANYFGVSKQSARIRLLDLGFREAEGSHAFIDDHYVGSYSFKAESKNADQTFCINPEDAFRLYSSDDAFRGFLDSGNYVYVDNHFVLRDPKFLEATGEGGVRLTDYAKDHIDECSLRFDLKSSSRASLNVDIYLETSLFRSVDSGYQKEPAFNVDKHNQELMEKAEAIGRNVAEELNFVKSQKGSFCQEVMAHVKRRGYNKPTFCEKTLLSERMFERIQTDSLRRNLKPETVMQICIGLDLGIAYGEALFEKAGHKLCGSELHLAYKQILATCQGLSVYECNEILASIGLPLLAKRSNYRTKAD